MAIASRIFNTIGAGIAGAVVIGGALNMADLLAGEPVRESMIAREQAAYESALKTGEMSYLTDRFHRAPGGSMDLALFGIGFVPGAVLWWRLGPDHKNGNPPAP